MNIIAFMPKSPYSERIEQQLKSQNIVPFYLVPNGSSATDSQQNVIELAGSFYSSNTIKNIFAKANELKAEQIILITHPYDIQFKEVFFELVNQNKSPLLYADYENGNGEKIELIDYQKGSIRDNFDFGPVLIIRPSKAFIDDIVSMPTLKSAGLYWLTLRLSVSSQPRHIDTVLYSIQEKEAVTKDSTLKQFDYLDPTNREVQKEFELVATEHLKAIGAFIDYRKLSRIDYRDDAFQRKVSVVIPVFNRERTIADAIKSALEQDFQYPYNIIVVDNHSTDKTTAIIDSLAKGNDKIVHIIPSEKDLGIGGCWNKAIYSDECGEFAIQLDSDDLYADKKTLQTVYDKFREGNYAMVIGSYKITNFALETLSPGTIDHREWTDTNGMNNALRINGLGAPRAFYTPVVRQIGFENCSYGEDYAMGLAISRQFTIGRIYDIIYICRRWEGNSDANLSPEQQNRNNYKKDFMRTEELERRILLNKL